MVLTACKQTLDVASIEAEIKTDLSQRGLLIRSISCPSNLQSKAGQAFECTGALDPDGGFFITVKQVNEQGQMSWEVPNSWRLLNLAILENELEKTLQRQELGKIDCGGAYRPTKPGDNFECKLNGRTQSHRTILVKVEPQGNVTWREVRQVPIEPRSSSTVTVPSIAAPAVTAEPPTLPNQPAQIGIKDTSGWVPLAD